MHDITSEQDLSFCLLDKKAILVSRLLFWKALVPPIPWKRSESIKGDLVLINWNASLLKQSRWV